MASFAKIALLGNLGADPETKYTPNGSMIVELRIAVNPRPRQGQEGPPTWYRISAWDRLADRLDKLSQQGYVAKGRSLYVEGRLEPREYTANDGTQRISFDVTMTDFQFVGSDRREGEGGQDAQGGGNEGDSYGGGGGNRRSTYNDNPPSEMDDVPF